MNAVLDTVMDHSNPSISIAQSQSSTELRQTMQTIQIALIFPCSMMLKKI